MDGAADSGSQPLVVPDRLSQVRHLALTPQ